MSKIVWNSRVLNSSIWLQSVPYGIPVWGQISVWERYVVVKMGEKVTPSLEAINKHAIVATEESIPERAGITPDWCSSDLGTNVEFTDAITGIANNLNDECYSRRGVNRFRERNGSLPANAETDRDHWVSVPTDSQYRKASWTLGLGCSLDAPTLTLRVMYHASTISFTSTL